MDEEQIKPIKRVKHIEKTDIFTDEELKRIFSTLQSNASQEEAMFIKTLYYTGCRVSEITGNLLDKKYGFEPNPLKPDSISVSRGVITIRNLKPRMYRYRCSKCHQTLSASTKTCYCGSQEIQKELMDKRFKTVEVPKEFLLEMAQYIELHNIKPYEPIFDFDRFKAGRIVRHICKLANIGKLGTKQPHCHNFRHQFVMIGVRNGVPMKYLQKQTGHASLTQLGEYIEISEEEKADNLNKMWKNDADRT